MSAPAGMTDTRRPMRRLGILGGMGPLATADFYRRLVEHTPADVDQEHLPVAMWADPRVPDRTAALLGNGPSPVPALLEGVRWLESAGVDVIAIPCNTAHAYVEDIRAASDIPLLDMIGTAFADAQRRTDDVTRIGVLSTRGTRAAKLYERAAETLGGTIVQVPDAAQTDLVDRAIRAVKNGADLREAELWIESAAQILRDLGAQVAIAACTEIPLVSAGAAGVLPVVDSTASLVESAVARLWS
ncbi:aspartate/glutamate racemase family protein [Embleya sp. NPDC050154]|uniref:aspartate/glutamate racemase family protein n=1 Tax=unclassified Embleya TaxID=2699296 RepID=UPI0037989BEB